ncbi:MAG TPA: acyl-CoA dehydrogenase family protein [Polyangiales bacterium]|nr:acyl-CoA dehydrogenase family protein [Polyangiales bacterium]
MSDPTPQEIDDFRAEVRAWIHKNKPPKPPFKMPDSFMEVGTDEQFEYLRAWQNKVYRAGYLGMTWPKEYGGGGKSAVLQRVVTSEMARANVPFMVNVIGLMWAGPTILKLGSHEQKLRYIPKILSGDEIWCQGFSEPENGSDLANAQMTAVRDGNEYVLNGTKIWTSLGKYAAHMILLARTDKSGPSKYHGLSFFLAPMRIPNVTTIPIKKLTGEHGFTETRFEDARIPASCIVGNEGEGWPVAITVLAFERGAEGGQAGGLAMVPLRAAQVVELAKTLKRDGKPAIEDPLVRDKLLQFVIEERGLELALQRTRIPALAQPRPFAVPMMGKLRVTEFRRRLCAFAISLQGSNANLYVGDPDAFSDGDWQRGYMNAFSATIGGGTSQIQMNIIGERILGLGKG